jgi:hypothetical protein
MTDDLDGSFPLKENLMFRRFVTYLSLFFFCWTQTALAMTGQGRFTTQTDFLNDSGLTQRSVSLKELQDKYGKFLPDEISIQMQHLIEENPHFMLPKITVNKVVVGGKEQLQMNFNLPEGSVVLTAVNSDKVAFTLVGQVNGQSINQQITPQMIAQAHQIIYAQRLSLKKQGPVILTATAIMKLSDDRKAEYIQSLRQLMEASEAAQRAHLKGKNVKTTLYKYFFEKLVEDGSFADDPNKSGPSFDSSCPLGGSTGVHSCIIAGYTNGCWNATQTNDNNSPGVCNPGPDQQKSSGCQTGSIACNPLLYGDGACVGFASKADRANATIHCGNNDPNGAGAVRTMKKNFGTPKDHAELEAKLAQLRAEVKRQIDDCKTYPHAAGADQQATCFALQHRVDLINSLDCGTPGIDGDPDFSQQLANLCPAPQPVGPVADNHDNESLCTNDGCNVPHAKKKHISCGDGDHKVSKEICANDCDSGYTPILDGGADKDHELQSCELKADRASIGGGSNFLSSIGKFLTSPGFLLIMGVVAIGGIAFYMEYSAQQTAKKAYEQYEQEFQASVATGATPIPTLAQPFVPGASYLELLKPGTR